MSYEKVLHGEVELAYKVREPEGRPDAETLLLIMGIDFTTEHWGEHFLDALAERYRVIVFDNRGTGESTRRVPDITPELWMDDALAVLDDLGVESCHVLGYSMGGRVAQELVATHPDVVKSLILLASAIGGSEMVHPRSDALAHLFAPPRLPAEEVRRLGVKIVTGPDFSTRHPDRLEELVQISLRRPTHMKILQKQIDVASTMVADRLDGIRQPVCIIHGDADALVPIANGLALHRHMPQAKFVTLHGIGHLPMWECPEALVKAIVDFIG